MAFVLVHGGGFAASCWDRLVPQLDGDVLAVDLPGRGSRPAPLDSVTIASCVDAVVADVEAAGFDDVVLVGHSLAGATLPGVADRIPGLLRRLVFVSCTVPDDGTSILDALSASPADTATTAADRASGDADTGRLAEGLARQWFANDLSEADTQWMLDRMVAEAPAVITERVALAGLRRPVPRTWVRLRQDAIVTPAAQDRYVATVGGDIDVVDLDAGHMAMIGKPAELAAILNAL